MRVHARLASLLLLPALAAGCAHAPSGGSGGRVTASATAAPVDSATLLLYRLDETGGYRVFDSASLRMEGRAGIDTRTEFGRIKNGRLFTRSVDSFVYFAYRATLDTEAGFTVEAWVNPAAFGQYEATPIAGRWNLGAGEQSWLLGMVGQNMKLPFASLPSPGYLNDLNLEAREGTLFFAYQPEDAGPPRVYRSSVRLPLERWSHVAASFDGEIVRIFIDGQLDAQFASIGRIRGSRAPLLLGNFFNWRWLTDFGGDLRVDPTFDRNPYYAFEGVIDELRLSTVARTEFPHARYSWEPTPKPKPGR